MIIQLPKSLMNIGNTLSTFSTILSTLEAEMNGLTSGIHKPFLDSVYGNNDSPKEEIGKCIRNLFPSSLLLTTNKIYMIDSIKNKTKQTMSLTN